MLWVVSSATTYNEWWEVFVNFAGQMSCDCPDAWGRTKKPHLVDLLDDKRCHACKHQRAVAEEIKKCLTE